MKPIKQFNILILYTLIIMFDTACTKYQRLVRKVEQGDPIAMRELGLLYRRDNGRDVRMDYKIAVHWLTKAAEKGDIEAMIELAGTYCIVDPSGRTGKAAYWYMQADDRFDTRGTLELAKAYQYGDLGLQKDKIKAKYYYQRLKDFRPPKN